MTSAILRNQIDRVIQDMGNQVYEEWISSDLEEIERYQNRIRQTDRRLYHELNQEIQNLTHKLQLFLNVPRTEVQSELRQMNRIFHNIQSAEESLQRQLELGQKQLYKACQDTSENLEEYLPELDVDEVYESFLAQKPFHVRLPVIGETTIDPIQIDKQMNLPQLIAERLKQFDLTQYAQRTTEILDECRVSAKEVETRMDKLTNMRSQTQSQLGPLVFDAVKHIEALGMRSQPEIVKFVQNIESVLELPITIEIDAPDISKDILFAELLTLCDQTGGRERLLQIGQNLGYPIEELINLPQNEICRRLVQHFTY